MTKTEVCRLCDLNVAYDRLFIFVKKYIFAKLVIDSVSCTDIIKYALESIRFEKIPGVHQIRREECVYAALRNSR